MRNKFLGGGEQGYNPLRKLKVILSGLRFAVMYDFSVEYKLVVSAIIIIFAIIFERWIDAQMLLLATGLVLMAELFNSAIEAICDFIEPNKNEKIRAIKDIAAAAVAVIMVIWVIIVIRDIVAIFGVLSERWRG
ncbi:MAG: diacylglycerol kinase [Candidatus Competibacteraceae bacterium]|nr:diacylglycerol kinase [Candidatus Competibacteraceae bacterium]